MGRKLPKRPIRCPRCGGKPKLVYDGRSAKYHYECEKCGLRGKGFYSRREALYEWNFDLMFMKFIADGREKK
jgi:transcription elongation factor Elf1